jgi:hypothetical protein
MADPAHEIGTPPVGHEMTNDPNKISYAVVGVDGGNLLVDYKLGENTVQLRLPYTGDKENLPKYLSRMVTLTGLADIPQPRTETTDLAQFLGTAGTVKYEHEEPPPPPPPVPPQAPASPPERE